MNYSENFRDFIYWYTSLVNDQIRKKYFHGIADHHNGTLSDDLKQINYPDRDMETGDYVGCTIDLDNHLYSLAKIYLDNQKTRIIPFISIEEDLPKLLTSLRLTYDEIIEQELQKKYLGYSIAIQKLGKALSKIQKASKPRKSGNTSGKSYGIKTQRAYELRPLADKIIKTQDHEEAVNMLVKDFNGFNWDRPHKYFFTGAGKPNISQISHALSLVAQIKWTNNYPSMSLIRRELFYS